MMDLSYDAGGLRTVPVTIGGTAWKPEFPHEESIIKRLDEIDKLENRLEAALEMFCFIARSQMFLDGNKRVAQLMCNKIMIENDMGIFSVPYDRIDMFKELLVHFYETNRSEEIKGFFKEECLLLNPAYKQK
jgi:Fic family protein